VRIISRIACPLLVVVAALALTGCVITSEVPRFGMFETSFSATEDIADPFQDVDLLVTFTSPSRVSHTVRGFWDGGDRWRVRFNPDEEGAWTYATETRPADVAGLARQVGTFRVGPPSARTSLAQHGPIKVAATGTYLEHADGTPFFWMADTAWNGPLMSDEAEWGDYIVERKRQGFSVVQWVATQWRAAPAGDREGRPAFTGRDRIAIDPQFFQRLDEKVAALDEAGLLSAPVLLWAISSGTDPMVNPGHALPEDQAARLARYMVARWQGYPSVWMLGGDGDYRGQRAERWQRIGRAVFDGTSHAPALMHPGGLQWVLAEFATESWVAIHGYQSGHGDGVENLRWITEGPASRDWNREPRRPFINLEPPYENHLAYQSRRPHSADSVRRALYWSLLNAPTAGVSYGGHGVWGWDDGTTTPTDHPGSGVPLPWPDALVMPGAEQVRHLVDAFTSMPFWRLRPAQNVLVDQPGVDDAGAFVAVSAADDGNLIVAYSPTSEPLAFRAGRLSPSLKATWIDPVSGRRYPATMIEERTVTRFVPPGDGDWLLVMTGAGSLTGQDGE
jgi:hypothetical protein